MKMKICHKCRMEHPAEYTCEQVQQDTQRSPMLLQHARSRYYQALGDLDHVADSYHYAETRLKTRQEQLKMMAERELEPPPKVLRELKQMKVEKEVKLYGGAREGGKSHLKAILDELGDTPFGHGLLNPKTGRISSAQPIHQELPCKAAVYPDPSARRDAQHEQALTQPAARFDPFAGYEVKRGAYASEDHMQEPARHPLQRVTEQPGWDGQSKWRPWE